MLTDGLTVRKRAGKLSELEAALAAGPIAGGTTAMGHTRWATHGPPSDENAHPHLDCSGRVAVIHNGIVENHQELRVSLEKEGHGFVSETDTEVVAHLIEAALDGEHDLTAAVRSVIARLEGAYSLVVLSAAHPGELVGVKVSSPLVVGLGNGETILASDIPAVLERTRVVVPLDEGQIATIWADGVAVTTLDGAAVDVEPITVDWDVSAAQKSGYDWFMRKEIDEQPKAIRDTLVGRVQAGRLALDELRIPDDVLREVSKVFVVACGTAFHSGLVAKYAIEHWTRLPVEIEIASEFRYRDPVMGPDALTLAVSQSGETIDTLEAARHARRQGSQVIAVTNTVGSSLAREADGVLYTHAARRSASPRPRRSPRRWSPSSWSRCTWRRSAGRSSPRRSRTCWWSCPRCPGRSSARSRSTGTCARSPSGSWTRGTTCSSAATPATRPLSRAPSS